MINWRLVTMSLCVVTFVGKVHSDTVDVKTQSYVEVKTRGAHCRDDANCFNRFHPAIKPVARARPGQLIRFETRDAEDADFTVDSVDADLARMDLNLVHPMTGPVHIEGARRGDVVAVTIIDIDPNEYGYTTAVPGIGLLRDVFTKPLVVNWKLNRMEAVSEQVPGVRIPFNGFVGNLAVMPGPEELETWLTRESELLAAGGFVLAPNPSGALPDTLCGPNGSDKDRCVRTLPPRENGGNMDIKQMVVGTTILLPCFVDGCGLSVGDVHFAQGDGESAGTAIEMGARVTVRTSIRKGLAATMKYPHFEGGSQMKTLAPASFHATVGYPLKNRGVVPPHLAYLRPSVASLSNLSEDLNQAARESLLEMINWLHGTKGLTREQAYVVVGVACDVRVGNIVDVPNFAVSTVCPLEIFDPRE